jgi:hypothetical protein
LDVTAIDIRNDNGERGHFATTLPVKLTTNTSTNNTKTTLDVYPRRIFLSSISSNNSNNYHSNNSNNYRSNNSNNNHSQNSNNKNINLTNNNYNTASTISSTPSHPLHHQGSGGETECIYYSSHISQQRTTTTFSLQTNMSLHLSPNNNFESTTKSQHE